MDGPDTLATHFSGRSSSSANATGPATDHLEMEPGRPRSRRQISLIPSHVPRVAATVLIALLGACGGSNRTAVSGPGRPARSTPPADVIELSPRIQGLVGVKSAPLVTAAVPPLSRVSGRVIDSAGLVPPADRRAVLVRLNAPPRRMPGTIPGHVRLLFPGVSHPAAGRLLRTRSTATAPHPDQGLLYLVADAPTRLSPGAHVTGFLPQAGPPVFGVIVPDGAITRKHGHAWVYLRIGPTGFARRSVTLVQPTADGWLATGQVAPGDPVVIAGVRALVAREKGSDFSFGG